MTLKHGESNSPEYRSWHHMKSRCLNPNDKDYRYYGGRGITIDPRWRKFDNFLADMGRRPTLKHTLERIDNNGNYCKNNCKWATWTEQNRNNRQAKLTQVMVNNIRRLHAKGHTPSFLALMFGVDKSQICNINRGVYWK